MIFLFRLNSISIHSWQTATKTLSIVFYTKLELCYDISLANSLISFFWTILMNISHCWIKEQFISKRELQFLFPVRSHKSISTYCSYEHIFLMYFEANIIFNHVWISSTYTVDLYYHTPIIQPYCFKTTRLIKSPRLENSHRCYIITPELH